jgi:hypothetical protein
MTGLGRYLYRAPRLTAAYDKYNDYYRPVVPNSKALMCTTGDQEFTMVWQRRVLFVTAAIQSPYQGHDVVADRQRGYNIADTTEVQEIQTYGHAGAPALVPDTKSS